MLGVGRRSNGDDVMKLPYAAIRWCRWELGVFFSFFLSFSLGSRIPFYDTAPTWRTTTPPWSRDVWWENRYYGYVIWNRGYQHSWEKQLWVVIAAQANLHETQLTMFPPLPLPTSHSLPVLSTNLIYSKRFGVLFIKGYDAITDVAVLPLLWING